jgi:hypothetical protein
MAVAYRIPSSSRSGIEQLVRLSDEALQELITALAEADPVLNVEDLTQRIASRDDLTISGSEATSAVRTAFEIAGVLAASKASLRQFSENIAQSSDLDMSDGDRRRLTAVLEKLLSIPSIVLSARALQNAYDHYRILQDCSMYTDIRPLFSENPGAGPFAVAVMHSLRLSFYEDGQVRSVFLSLDSNDVRNLQRLVSQALEQANALSDVLERATLRMLTPGDGTGDD